MTSDSRRKSKKFGAAAKEACRRLLGDPVKRLEFPGGRSRKSARAILENRSVIVTRRRPGGRAYLEANVLGELSSRSNAVPRVLAFDGTWLIQEDVGKWRLSQALAGASQAESERWLDRAMGALAEIHQGRAMPGWPRTLP